MSCGEKKFKPISFCQKCEIGFYDPTQSFQLKHVHECLFTIHCDSCVYLLLKVPTRFLLYSMGVWVIRSRGTVSRVDMDILNTYTTEEKSHMAKAFIFKIHMNFICHLATAKIYQFVQQKATRICSNCDISKIITLICNKLCRAYLFGSIHLIATTDPTDYQTYIHIKAHTNKRKKREHQLVLCISDFDLCFFGIA